MKTPQYLVRLAAASRDLTAPVFQSVQQNDDATIRHLVPNGWVEIFHSFEVGISRVQTGSGFLISEPAALIAGNRRCASWSVVLSVAGCF